MNPVRESTPHNLADDGFEHLGQLLTSDEVSELRRISDEPMNRSFWPGHYGQMWHNPWSQLPLFFETISEKLAPAAASALGVDRLTLFQDILIDKSPGAKTVQWHQDYSYWPLDSAAGLTLWVALEDADTDNGCLHYIPGTHLMGERQPANFFIDTEQPRKEGLPDLDAESRENEAVAVPARAGDVLAHHPLTWHMSPANETDRHRHAWSITLLAPGVHWAPDHAPHPYEYQLKPQPGTLLSGPQFPQFQLKLDDIVRAQ